MIKELEKYIDRELISADEISRRVKELGAEITKDYEGKSVIMVCILRGASVFFADLVREIDVDLSMDFMVISSYGSGTTSSGEVKLVKDLSEGIKGKNVTSWKISWIRGLRSATLRPFSPQGSLLPSKSARFWTSRPAAPSI